MSAEENQYWAYVLQNPQGRFYIGSTDDLDRRVKEHNDTANPKSKYTVKHGPWKLVWSESHRSRAEAMAREKQIKKMKSANWIRAQLLIDQLVERVPMYRD